MHAVIARDRPALGDNKPSMANAMESAGPARVASCEIGLLFCWFLLFSLTTGYRALMDEVSIQTSVLHKGELQCNGPGHVLAL